MGERFARGPDMDKAANEGLDKRLEAGTLLFLCGIFLCFQSLQE